MHGTEFGGCFAKFLLWRGTCDDAGSGEKVGAVCAEKGATEADEETPLPGCIKPAKETCIQAAWRGFDAGNGGASS